MKKTYRQSGFTAVELLVTLFVAAAFLLAGYQLYGLIIKDGGQTRSQTRASNVAYDYLQRYKTTATNPCTVSTPVNNLSIVVTNLSNVTVTVAITCPYALNTSISKVQVTLGYNNPKLTIINATYVGNTTATGTVTNGRVLALDAGDVNSYPGSGTSWLDLSGNSNNGTLINGITYSNGSLNLNGTNSFVDCGSSISYNMINQFTISAWIKPSINSVREIIVKSDNTNAGVGPYEFFQSNNTVTFRTAKGGTVINFASAATISIGTWVNIVAVWDGTTKYIYINGYRDTNTQLQSAPLDTSTGKLIIGAYANALYPFSGSISDVDIYNRALSASEIQQNFSSLSGRYGL